MYLSCFMYIFLYTIFKKLAHNKRYALCRPFAIVCPGTLCAMPGNTVPGNMGPGNAMP